MNYRSRATVSGDPTHKSTPTFNGHRQRIKAQNSAWKIAKVNRVVNIATDDQTQASKASPAKKIAATQSLVLSMWSNTKTGQVKGTQTQKMGYAIRRKANCTKTMDDAPHIRRMYDPGWDSS